MDGTCFVGGGGNEGGIGSWLVHRIGRLVVRESAYSIGSITKADSPFFYFSEKITC